MAITATQNNGDYVSRLATGSYLDTASAAATIKLGFQPRYFTWLDVTNADAAFWMEGMANGAKFVEATAGAKSFSATAGFTWDATTGSMVIDASLVQANAQYHWMAMA